MPMNWCYPVNPSSFVHMVGFDHDTRELGVQIKSAGNIKTYTYPRCTPDDHIALLNAASTGKAFSAFAAFHKKREAERAALNAAGLSPE